MHLLSKIPVAGEINIVFAKNSKYQYAPSKTFQLSLQAICALRLYVPLYKYIYIYIYTVL